MASVLLSCFGVFVVGPHDSTLVALPSPLESYTVCRAELFSCFFFLVCVCLVCFVCFFSRFVTTMNEGSRRWSEQLPPEERRRKT